MYYVGILLCVALFFIAGYVTRIEADIVLDEMVSKRIGDKYEIIFISSGREYICDVSWIPFYIGQKVHIEYYGFHLPLLGCRRHITSITLN